MTVAVEVLDLILEQESADVRPCCDMQSLSCTAEAVGWVRWEPCLCTGVRFRRYCLPHFEDRWRCGWPHDQPTGLCRACGAGTAAISYGWLAQ